MDLFDEKVYDEMEKGYEEERKRSRNGFNRAMLGVLPFSLQEGEDIKLARKLLSECSWINGELKRRVRPYSGVVADTVREILDANAEVFANFGIKDGKDIGEKGGEYFVSMSKEYIKRVEQAYLLWKKSEIALLTVRGYALLNLFITG